MMNCLDGNRIGKAEHVFSAVVDLPPEERAVALETRCGDDTELRSFVERLLEIDDRTSADVDRQVPFTPVRGQQPPFQIGRYNVVRTLGEGGMGTVYEAEQEHPQRTVALKLMMRGIASRSALRRFEHEAQILARLRHPAIAHVYDVGVFDDGSVAMPYFVMEYIPGAKPITEFARMKNLSTRQRLELFISVCDAAQHGHQKGIIHRDLKPGNIVVDSSGAVKVIDFGVARVTDSDMAVTTMQTDVGQLIGTLQYMSPEQCDADPHDLDVRSDVYALGAVLYELLTDQLPYDVSNARIYVATRIIREMNPARPSSFNRAMRGDLETITLKALEKDRERRYQSASDLAEDIRRYLTDRPIMARPPRAMYQFRTFARRNKALVGGVAATFIALIAGLIGVTAMYVQAEHLRAAEAEQRRFAEEREQEALSAKEAEAEAREEADKIAEFQQSQLAGIEAAVIGAGIRRSILERRRAALTSEGHDEEDIERMLHELDVSLTSVNFTNIALEVLDENIFERALDAIDEQFADQPLVKARLFQTVADTLRNLGLVDRAIAPQTEALDFRRRVLGDEHPDTLNSINNMGLLLQRKGGFDEAEPYHDEALETRRRVYGDDHPDTLISINNMGFLLQQQGKYAEAEPYHRVAIEGGLRVFGRDHPSYLNFVSKLASSLRRQGKYAEAESYYREALEGSRRVLGDEHPTTLGYISNLGVLLRHQGRHAEAEQYYREPMEIRRRVLGEEHSSTLMSINNYAVLLRIRGKLAEAEPYQQTALEGRRRILGNEHPETLFSINNMGILLQRQGRYAEAEPYLLEALETRRRVLGNDHPRTLMSVNNVGVLLHDQGRVAEAEQYLIEALAMRWQVLGSDHPETLVTVCNMGALLRDQGRLTEAELHLRMALDSRRRVLGDRHPETLVSISNMGVLRRDQGHLEEAERLGDEAVHGARAVFSNEHWRSGVFLSEHGRTLAAMARFKQTEDLMLEAHSIFASSLGEQHPRTIEAIKHLADLYENWHEAEPDAGHDASAAEWRAKLQRLQHESD